MTTTQSGSVAADGVLAWVTFDTTGLMASDGPFTLSMNDTLNGATDFAGIPATITDGQLSIVAVPEPNACTLFLFAFGGLAVRRRGRRVASSR